MEKEIFKQNYERILKIKEDFDARKIDIEDIPDEDVKLILDIYNLQIKKVNAEIEKAERNLIAIKPNRSNIRKPYTSGRNKYRTNLRNNM